MTQIKREVLARAGVLGGATAAMWLVRILDSFGTGRSAAGHGVVPRTMYGLEGIPTAPFIHADFEHLVANTIPFILLGVLILFRGVAEFLFVTLVSGLVGGLGTWLFGQSNSEHIGASGIVFGFFGYLLFRAAFDRRISSILLTVAVLVLYGASMAYSLVPEEGISWSGHFFGLVGGYVAARLRYPLTRNREKISRTLAVIPLIAPPFDGPT
ncbi:MAG TPA: rhomboid family intramembrane serine protease [Thermoanaerobaculia bacterium]|nr:rhomboid family intramembrane serine protease [Thermoanaerobaculia bacterium]